jgi:hypothetical protein
MQSGSLSSAIQVIMQHFESAGVIDVPELEKQRSRITGMVESSIK